MEMLDKALISKLKKKLLFKHFTKMVDRLSLREIDCNGNDNGNDEGVSLTDVEELIVEFVYIFLFCCGHVTF